MSEDVSKKYTLKISKEMADIIQRYIDRHPELGYRSVSEYITELIRTNVKEIKKELLDSNSKK